jgi:hypothetical protein
MPMTATERFAVAGARGRLIPLLLVAFCALLPVAASAGGIATAGSPARLAVSVPPAARGEGVVMLELGIASAHRAAGDHLGALVRLRRPGGQAVELGRVSIVAAGARRGQRYQFNLAPALRQLDVTGGSAEVEVELIERGDGGPVASGAALNVGPARIVTR